MAKYTEVQLAKARKKVSGANSWRLKNPGAWHYVVHMALNQASEGKQVSGRQLVEAVRKKDFSDVDGKPTRTNNDHAAVIVRWLVIEHPQLSKCIELRCTALDEIMTAYHG